MQAAPTSILGNAMLHALVARALRGSLRSSWVPPRPSPIGRTSGWMYSILRLHSHRAWPTSAPPTRVPLRYLAVAPGREGPATVPLAALEVHASGPPVALYVQKADCAARLGLQVRDLRVVDPTFRSAGSAVLPRPGGIIVALGHVRVIILAERVLVFDPVNPHVEAFVGRLQGRLVRPAHPMPFEFRALEAVLVETCASLSRQLGVVVPSVDLVLDTLAERPDFGGYTVQNCLDRLLPLENALNDFADRVDATRAALLDVLASDVGAMRSCSARVVG